MLHTQGIVLEEISQNDVDFIFQCYSNAETMKYFGVRPIETTEEAIAIINRNISMNEELTGIRYIAKLKDTAESIGLITMKRYIPMDFRAEIDYIVIPKYQGYGFATEMLQLFLQKLSEEWDLERITAYVHLDNLPSYKMLEKVGFIREGILRSWAHDGDDFYDLYSYSFLLSELKLKYDILK